jgi:hypothetical protein
VFLRTLVAAWLCLAAAGVAPPAAAQVVETPHWLAPTTGASPCERPSNDAAGASYC